MLGVLCSTRLKTACAFAIWIVLLDVAESAAGQDAVCDREDALELAWYVVITRWSEMKGSYPARPPAADRGVEVELGAGLHACTAHACSEGGRSLVTTGG